MKKIGILTHYHDKKNYGGILQAYALVEIIHQAGYCVEQIPLRWYGKNDNVSFKSKVKKFCRKSIYKKIRTIGRLLLKKPFVKIRDGYVSSRREQISNIPIRSEAFRAFRDGIPHNQKVYDNTNIAEVVSQYDCFITGSDQVWNMLWYYPEYFLDFVPKGIPKFSYAASVSMSTLNDEQKEIFRKSLTDYQAVSVREMETVDLLSDLSPVPVEWVLDPTLLLTEEDWLTVSTKERRVGQEYIFCFFLTNDKIGHKLAKEFSQRTGLVIVNLPHMNDAYKKQDVNFGDIDLYDVTPNDFLGLIRDAKYVFTDSFHVTVFSNIFRRNYFIVNRIESSGMDTRIRSLLSLFGTEERFCNCDERRTIEYIMSLGDIDYAKSQTEFEAMKAKSLDFLERNLAKAIGD